MLSTAMDLSNSEPSIKEERPEDIPPEVWETRSLLKNPKPNLDSVVSDLIASGIDANGIIRLVDYIQNTPESPVEEVTTEKDQNPVINICGRLHTLPFSRSSVERIFPINFTIWVLILSTVFGFSSSYLPLSLVDQFPNKEKWWISFICGTSIFSILKPPDSEPYLTFTPDSWTGLCRPLYITLLCTIWRVSIDAQNERPIAHFPFYGWEIEWNIILPYIFDICRYGLLFFPIFIFYGFIGHPVSTIVTILESSCRYLFGQNGVKSILHLSIQIIRGSASVACCWGLLQYRCNDLTISISITIATFLGCIPLYFQKNRMNNIFIMFLYPFILTATSFISSYCLCYLLISEKSNENHKKEIILWFSFSWFLLVDIIYPYLTSNQHYFFCHFKILRTYPYLNFVRNFSQLIVGPLFLSTCLLHSSFHPLLLSFIIVHATQKYSAEPHAFALSVILTVATLPSDFDLENYSANLLISLLITAKVEIFIPQVKMVYRTRCIFEYADLISDLEVASIIFYPITRLLQHFPFSDFVSKIPALFWSFFTGSSFISTDGKSLYLSPGPPRAFYFFDWPVKDEGGEKVSFMKHVSEHPIETPVYASITRALSKDFANLVRSGRLGYVNSGDIFLIKSDGLAAFIHIISQEPSTIRIQVRGLEYDDQTTCHRSEISSLNDVINNYNNKANLQVATYTAYCQFDIRDLFFPLHMYDVMYMKIDQAFVGIDSKQVYEIFLSSFAYVVATKKEKLFEVRPISAEDEERARPFRTSNLMLKIRTIASKRINNHNNNNNSTTTNLISETTTTNNNNNNENNSDDEDDENDNNNASVNENDSIQIDNENNIGELDDEEANLAVNLWLVIAMTLFNNENMTLKTDTIVESFRGNPQFSESQNWIYNSPSLLVEVIIPSIQLGCGAAFIASAGSGPDFDENGNANPDDMLNFLKDTKQQNFLTPLDSARFQKAFFSEKNKAIISLGSVKREDKIIRFKLNRKEWTVFKMNHEWMRALWSNDVRDIIFYSETDGERDSIQQNEAFLNNMILQSADIPVGYPAFTSEIIDSYLNPFCVDKM